MFLLYDVLIDITLFSEMFYYLQGIILSPKTLYDAGSEIIFDKLETIHRNKWIADSAICVVEH